MGPKFEKGYSPSKPQEELEAAVTLHSSQEAEKGLSIFISFSLSYSAQGTSSFNGATHTQGRYPTFSLIFPRHSFVDSPRDVSIMVLNPVKLTKIDHHIH